MDKFNVLKDHKGIMDVLFHHKDKKKKDKLDVLIEHKGIGVEPLYVLNASSFHKCVLKII